MYTYVFMQGREKSHKSEIKKTRKRERQRRKEDRKRLENNMEITNGVLRK